MVDIEIEIVEHLILFHCLTDKGLWFREIFNGVHTKIFSEDVEEFYNFVYHNKIANDIIKQDNILVIPAASNIELLKKIFTDYNITYKILN